jgi:hypothetical protein
MRYIYTANYFGYDNLKEQPTYPGWKYVCFSDRHIKSKTWEVRVVQPYPKIFRHLKTCPHVFLPKAEETIWIDANITLERLTHLFKGDFCVMERPLISTLEEELAACIRFKKDDERTMTAQVERYLRDGYKGQEAMCTGAMYRINNPTNQAIGEAWWTEIKKGSVRDQLSLGYVLWKTGGAYTTIPFLEGMRMGRHNYRYKGQ